MSSNERTCEWVRDRIDAFVDGAESDLADDERADVARHVASCIECAEELALARRVGAELRAMAIPAAPPAVVERAQAHVASERDRVVRLRPRDRARRWASIAAAAVLLIAALWIEGDRRRAAETVAIEQATYDAAVAFAYLSKYARRTGDIVEDEVIERRLVAPVERAMEKTGVTETKTDAGQS
jgi:anti-sigma factor RsiW